MLLMLLWAQLCSGVHADGLAQLSFHCFFCHLAAAPLSVLPSVLAPWRAR